MDTTGEVTDLPWQREFEWKIEDFSTLPSEDDEHYASPLFYFANASWYLWIHPNGTKSDESVGYVDLYLMRKSYGSPIKLDYSLILKSSNEKTEEETDHSYLFGKAGEGYGGCRKVLRSKLLETWSECGLPDVLTVICKVKNLKSADDASDIVKKTSEAEAASFYERKLLDEPMTCPTCYNTMKLRDWCDHDCQKFRAEASEKLSDDFKEMMLNGGNRDTIIKVKEEEFQLHRDVLVARNPYFSSMFENDMKEKNTGVVFIDDCEPEIFRIFVHFVYTGKEDKLSAENVCNVYETANKYQEEQLKKECLHLMMKTLSEDTFFDFIVFALKYDEKELFEKAVEFFTLKPKAIVRSVKWQFFAKEYPMQASELFIKTIDQTEYGRIKRE